MSNTDNPPTIAITGAAGYIGSRVVKDLQETHPDWELIALDNFYLGDVKQIGDLVVEAVDIRDRDALEATLSGADVVLHLAAISGVDDAIENPDLTYEVNVQGTNNVAWFCRKTGAGMVFPLSMATTLGNPDEFPITTDHERDPMNWYGRSKVLGEQAVETYAEGAFPAHLFMKSNLYGEHEIGDQVVSKGTVINFFVDRVFTEDPLTVYEPGTQARNYVHVNDVARAYVKSAEKLLEQREAGETGATAYEIASDEDPSVMSVAKTVQEIAAEKGIETEVTLVENPRESESMVSEFGIDTSKAKRELGWEPELTIEASVRRLLEKRTAQLVN
ncbi:UDP-glucose 4-epimerase [Halodesulfurarchaeum formicicum]|uniref:UDP-glucose 4-epimerase n=1 Tax=Halodesulfurarchaeum formicicum TaxID=1873524 RepID=A0A1D8S3Y9_9EURY|nr:NAD-dependent epimerase/dehydratase family protein [Halodesulfurarchaeum formicicum]AOW80071.1 UDP-glucose 4-epimerase [Halodesulfurarchaeum formicicum]